jgi:hypothetical protein
MTRIENLIVKGKYFIPAKPEQVTNLKNILTEYMKKKYFEPEDFRNQFFQDRFLTLNFKLPIDMRESLRMKIKKFLHLMSEDEVISEIRFSELKRIRNEYPFEIKMFLSLQKVQNIDGVVIEISSIPTVYYKLSQLSKELYLDEFEYSNVWYTNSEFIKEVMSAINATPLENPKVLSEYVKTEVSKKLFTYGFTKISKLLEDGKSKIEIGQNGIGELIGVIENFLYELIKKLNKEPSQLHQPEKNIDKLKGYGYINDEVCGTIQRSLYEGIYKKLKDKDHKKEEINYFDLRLYYQITEQILDYLLDRVIRYKFKINDKNEN